jgi:hypothetical protein
MLLRILMRELQSRLARELLFALLACLQNLIVEPMLANSVFVSSLRIIATTRFTYEMECRYSNLVLQKTPTSQKG